METFHGIQVYEILENGNLLNANYSNTGLLINGKFHIDNEIADKKLYDNEGVLGDYNCRYIESTDPLVTTNCDLKITKQDAVFIFVWSQNNVPIWKGLGLMSGTRHISVSYVGA